MEITTLFAPAINAIKSFTLWILKKFGLKIAPHDEFKDETVNVKMNYPNISQQCILEKTNGATFYWSEDFHPNYERYFEIDGNIRRFFIHDKNKLWIKRSDVKKTSRG